MLPLSPSRLGRYELVDEIGKGAMGVVYLARDPLIGRLVALKTFRIGYSIKDAELEQFRARFIREAQSAGILSHPNIVTIHDVVERAEEGLAFIAMEYVHGTNLKAALQERQRPALAYVAEILGQIADGLDYAHSCKVIHRDIKPANILITTDNRVKITDFGIARLGTSNLTQEGQLLGTPNYMSPEQILGRDVDHRADIFSLGVVLYEMVTLHKPFQGDNLTVVSHRIVYDHFTPPREYAGDLPPGTDQVLAKALEKDPARRYQRAREMADDLRRVLGSVGVRDPLNETQSLSTTAVLPAQLLRPPVAAPAPATSHPYPQQVAGAATPPAAGSGAVTGGELSPPWTAGPSSVQPAAAAGAMRAPAAVEPMALIAPIAPVAAIAAAAPGTPTAFAARRRSFWRRLTERGGIGAPGPSPGSPAAVLMAYTAFADTAAGATQLVPAGLAAVAPLDPMAAMAPMAPMDASAPLAPRAPSASTVPLDGPVPLTTIAAATPPPVSEAAATIRIAPAVPMASPAPLAPLAPGPAGAAAPAVSIPATTRARVMPLPRPPALPSPRRLAVLLAAGAGLGLLLIGGLALWMRSLQPRPSPLLGTSAVQRREAGDASRVQALNLMREGRRRLEAGDPEGAAAAFRAAERLVPGRLGLRKQREEAERLQGDRRQRLDLERTIGSKLDEGRLALNGRRYEEAEAAAQTVLAMSPGNTVAEGILASAKQGRAHARDHLATSARQPLRAGIAVPAARPEVPAREQPPPPPAPEARDATVELVFFSQLPEGSLLVYVNGDKVLRETFRFYEKGRLFLSRPSTGSVRRSFGVKPGAAEIRIYVTPKGSAAVVRSIPGNFAAGTSHRLDVQLTDGGQVTTQLN
jgi:tRNA A-37 threonylcarbamoyl transferase component Bud32